MLAKLREESDADEINGSSPTPQTSLLLIEKRRFANLKKGHVLFADMHQIATVQSGLLWITQVNEDGQLSFKKRVWTTLF